MMKNKVLSTILLLLISIFALSFTSCSELLSKLPFNKPGSDTGNNGNEITDSLVLIENNKALFQLVYTTDAGSDVIKRANELADQLSDIGVEISAPIKEGDPSLVSECEIIIGTGAKYRGEELSISEKELGKSGQIIKIHGKKILIAAGTKELTLSVFESFIKNQMGITKKTESLSSLVIDSDCNYLKETYYPIDSIEIAGINLNKYTIIYDLDTKSLKKDGEIKSFRQKIYDMSGYWLNEGVVSQKDTYENCFIFRYSENAGDKGFRVYAEDGDFIVECSYMNAIDRTFGQYAKEAFYTKSSGTISIPETQIKEYDVTRAYYKDFGAKGDGVSDDYAAILATHEYANQGGQKVYGTAGASYYISPKSFTESIPISTDVDFGGAVFIIDDRGNDAFANRAKSLFYMESYNKGESFDVTDVKNEALKFDGVSVSVPSGTTSLTWLAPYLECKSMVVIINGGHRDYIRYGGNQNSGRERHEVLIVDKDGSIDESTPVFFDYDKLTSLIICRTDDKSLTVENGTFYNICAKASLVNRGGITEYEVYQRGFSIKRSNVTLKNIKHGMVDQPEVISDRTDENGSYPYGGFFEIRDSYNITAEDCEFAGHITYYEKKAATSTSGTSSDYNYIAAGSYDILVGRSSNISFINAIQKNIPYTIDEKTNEISTANSSEILNKENYFGIGDKKFWGVMCSSFVKNISFEGGAISRIDAHEGFFNVNVTDTVIGHSFYAMGGGYINLKNMKKLTGNSYIITRSDYGGSFKGTITIENGELLGYHDYNSSSWFTGFRSFGESQIDYTAGFIINPGYQDYNNYSTTVVELSEAEKVWNWDFGYDCYMPSTITLIGSFKSGIPNIYISSNDYHYYWTYFVSNKLQSDPSYKGYALIKELIYQDWNGEFIPINRNYAAIGEEDYMFSHLEISTKNSK